MSDNPYTPYLQQLNDTLYDVPPSSFRSRIIVLCTLAAYGMLVSILYCFAFGPQYYLRAGNDDDDSKRRRWWIVRKVDDYVTMNLHFLLPVGGFLSCACMLVYSWTEYIVLQEHRMLGIVNSYRSFLWISIALHGYLVTCASVQAYVAVSSKTARMDNSLRVCRGSAGFWSRLRLPGPRTFNAMFYALTAVQVGSLLGADIAFTVSWNKLWSAIESLQSVLQSAEASWLPSSPPDILKLLELNALQETVLQRAKDNVPYQRAVVLVLIVDAFIIAVLNIGSGALYLLIRKQIRRLVARQSRCSLAAAANQRPGIATQMLAYDLHERGEERTGNTVQVHFPSPTEPTSPEAEEKDKEFGSPGDKPGFGRKFSLASLNSIWKSPSVPEPAAVKGQPNEQGIEMLSAASSSWPVDLGGSDSLSDLMRAEGDLIICVVVVVIMATAFMAENCWNYAHVLPNTVSWSETELSYFFVTWVYLIIYGIGCTGLIINSLLANRRRARIRRASSLAFPQSNNNMAAHGVRLGLGMSSVSSGGRRYSCAAREVRVDVESRIKIETRAEEEQRLEAEMMEDGMMVVGRLRTDPTQLSPRLNDGW